MSNYTENRKEGPADSDKSVAQKDSAKSRKRSQKPTQAAAMVSTVSKETLWHTPALVPYATIKKGRHYEHWPILSPVYKQWLAKVHYELTGRIPSGQALTDAINTIAGKARFDGPAHPVFTRVGKAPNGIYIDLGNSDWNAIKIEPTGWTVVRNPAIRFRRSKGMLALPVPVRGGSLKDLRPFINVENEDDWVLLISWLISTFRPSGSFPIAVLHGEQGSAKSTVTLFLRSLIDPNTAPLRSPPRDLPDVMIAANNSWVQAFNNLSHLQGWLSDAFCNLSTGGGHATRQKYTDEDEIIWDVKRPLIINGIEELATRADLLDRSIILYLPAIPEEKRQTETQLWTEFEEARPRILGALLDAVVGAMRRAPEIKLEHLPRMADFAVWAVAAAPFLGWEGKNFLSAYETNRDEANELALDASMLAGEVIKMLQEIDSETEEGLRQKQQERPDSGPWYGAHKDQQGAYIEGTATGLLEMFSFRSVNVKSKYWPKTPKNFSNALRRIATNLRGIGIKVDFFRKGKKRDRIITIRRVRPEDGVEEEGGRKSEADDRRTEGEPPVASAPSAWSATSGGAADGADDKTYIPSVQIKADSLPSPKNTPLPSSIPLPKFQGERVGKVSSASSYRPPDGNTKGADEADAKSLPSSELDLFDSDLEAKSDENPEGESEFDIFDGDIFDAEVGLKLIFRPICKGWKASEYSEKELAEIRAKVLPLPVGPHPLAFYKDLIKARGQDRIWFVEELPWKDGFYSVVGIVTNVGTAKVVKMDEEGKSHPRRLTYFTLDGEQDFMNCMCTGKDGRDEQLAIKVRELKNKPVPVIARLRIDVKRNKAYVWRLDTLEEISQPETAHPREEDSWDESTNGDEDEEE